MNKKIRVFLSLLTLPWPEIAIALMATVGEWELQGLTLSLWASRARNLTPQPEAKGSSPQFSACIYEHVTKCPELALAGFLHRPQVSLGLIGRCTSAIVHFP